MPTTPTTLPDVPLPPGAVYTEAWECCHDDGRHSRIINGATRGVEGNSDIQVWTAAVQYDDGTLDDSALEQPSVWIEAAQEALSSRQARELAAALLEAAAELDGWVGK